MRSMSQFGNDLYSGKLSFPFVGKRRLWFIIAIALIVGAAIVPIFKPVNFSIEFTGGSQFTISGLEKPDQTVARAATRRRIDAGQTVGRLDGWTSRSSDTSISRLL